MNNSGPPEKKLKMSTTQIFYFVDLTHPTRCDIVTDTESSPTEESYPTEYQLDDLPTSARPHLNPHFSRNKQLNNGKYERILLTSSKAVYIYKFPKIEPASSTTQESLELDRITRLYEDVDKVLPPVQSPDIALPVPRVFVAKLQIEEAVIEMLKSVGGAQDAVLAALREPRSAALSIVKSIQWDEYLGNERMTHQALIKTLQRNVFPKGFRVFGEHKDMAFPYTRFLKSMEDFSFFKPPTLSKFNETELNAVNVTSAGEDEFEVPQLIANMNNTAGHLATIALGAHTLFWQIHVYGILCDYSNMSVRVALKLELDFKNKRSILYTLITGPSGLTIEEAIIRVVSKIEGEH